ncbi:TcpD family membrane protein (plasmid) [Clostridium baratii]
MKKITKLNGLKERIKNKVIENKKKVERFIFTFMIVSAPMISAYADINPNTIKNNFINNFLKPIFIVAFLALLIKEYISKNTARLVISTIVGGFVAIFLYFPNAVEVIMNTLKNLFGL